MSIGQEAQYEIKKMKQGMSYSCKEKTIILNVFKYFRLQFPDKCVTEIVRRTSKATGCSEKSIFQFRKEESSAEGFKTPSKTKIRKNININSRDIKYDNTVRQSIRNIIRDLKNKNIMPSLNTILKQVKTDTTMPNFSLMTLRRLLFDMGFCYEKNGSKPVLVDKQQQENYSNDSKINVMKKQEGVEMKNNTVPNQSTYIPSAPPTELNEHKFMYIPQGDSYMMAPPPPPLSMDTHVPIHGFGNTLHLKREIPPWIHPHNHGYMVKQQ